jgi:hypothetical protein
MVIFAYKPRPEKASFINWLEYANMPNPRVLPTNATAMNLKIDPEQLIPLQNSLITKRRL